MDLLFQVDSPAAAWSKLREYLVKRECAVEELGILQALGYVLAEDYFSQEELPYFNRSVVDGYALKAADSYGVSESLPNYLKLLGKVEIGTQSDLSILPGTAVAVATGSMLPEGADAVIMLEHTSLLDENTLEINKPVSPGENVISTGEDYRSGDLILAKGKRIRAQEIGVLTALGYTEVRVFSRPKVAIISTGDELVSPQQKAEKGRIRDINSYTLSALVSDAGGLPLRLGIVPDTLEKLTTAIGQGLKIADLVLISGGSSVGSRDHTITAINKFGKPGVFVHGLSLKPGKPTAIGLVNDKPVFGLPGHPVSAFVVFELLVRPLIQSFIGLPEEVAFGQGRPRVMAYLGRNLPSATGREEYIQVRLENMKNRITAYPIFGKSGHISVFPLADGFIRIPANMEGLDAGETVEVIVYS